MENENENIDSPNDEIEGIDEELDIDVIKQKYADLTEKNKQIFARAKKAEGFELKDGKWIKPPKVVEEKPKEIETDKKVEISQVDLYALIKENVPQEDITDVTEYATLKKISIADALKSTFIKTLLSEKTEERKTAEATNTGAARRGSVQVSGDTLLSKASKGELPESDEDLERLVDARLNQKGKK